MQQFPLRHLYKHLGEALKQLPFEITDHNRPVARVIPIHKKDIRGNFKVTIDPRKMASKEDQ